MSEEEKEQEQKIDLNAFVMDIKAFSNSREFITAYLNEMYANFLHGRDIQEQLTNLRNASPRAFRLIASMIANEEEAFNDLVTKANLSEDEKTEMVKLRHAYKDLEKPIVRLVANARGTINHWTGFTDVKYSFNYNREVPQVEFKVFSFDKQIYHSKDDIDDIYKLSRAFHGFVLKSLNMLKESNLKFNPDLLDTIKDIASDVEKDNKAILSIVEDMKIKQEEKQLEEESKT